MLDAAWVDSQHTTFDVFHLHFGFDAKSPEQLHELVAALSRHSKPLVMTVHDLRNPHHAGRELHDEQLDVLIPAADALITLTPGAAQEIQSRWQREARVLAHPHVVDLAEIERRHALPGPLDGKPTRVGIHVKSLRASMDPRAVIPVLVRAVEAMDDQTILQVNGHTDVLSTSGARFDRGLADLLGSFGDRIDLRVHDFFDDLQLWDYLASLDVSVLPYRFGTHSGWLEACRDLGTTVVAPTCGFYAQQGPVESYRLDEDGFDEESLVAAVQRACRHRSVAVSVADRERHRHELAVAHRELYMDLLS